MLDTVGKILWVLMFCTPLITIPLVWRRSTLSKTYRVLLGLLLAFVISFVLFVISFSILLRDGLGSG
jgi:glucan phosphoethanolaminetransferase (alkaline phosphatase superfamily)